MKVLVTGGSGFIGTNLIQLLLEKGLQPANIDKAPAINKAHSSLWKKADILDAEAVYQSFCEIRPEIVIHLAARTDLNETKDLNGYAANIAGTENVLNAIKKVGSVRRAIIASSMLVCRLGYAPKHDQDYLPDTLYGQSKVLTETLTRDANLPCTWVIIRPTTLWGPWQQRQALEFYTIVRKWYYFHPNRDCYRVYGYVGNSVAQYRVFVPSSARTGRQANVLHWGCSNQHPRLRRCVFSQACRPEGTFRAVLLVEARRAAR